MLDHVQSVTSRPHGTERAAAPFSSVSAARWPRPANDPIIRAVGVSFSMSYDSIRSHLEMLQDSVRTEAYRDAIQQVVRPGDRVLDFGCGTGVLSIFAERAGAAAVYALDRSRMISVARVI